MPRSRTQERKDRNETRSARSRLRIGNRRTQRIELRPPNPGKEITDNLPTLQIDPEALDTYSEIDPLPELVGVMRDKLMFVIKIELPKWGMRGKVIEYGWDGVLLGLLQMNIGQFFAKRFISREREEDLAKLKKDILEYASSLGYICAFTKIDRRFIAHGKDRAFPYDTALVLGMEMDKTLLDETPSPGDKLYDFEVYVESGKRVFDVAKFIRAKGYRCYARVPFDGFVKYPPHAINAGLGELGAMGVVVTKQYGPRVRWTMISIDADIEIDRPVDLNMAAYCDDCMLCVKACPADAISRERIWWRGVYKRKNNDTKCYPYFVKYEGCALCLKICPINVHGYEECMRAYRRDGTILRKTGKRKKSNDV